MNYGAKKTIIILLHLFTWPFSLTSIIGIKYFSSETIYDFSAKLLSLIPSLPGQYLRASFYKLTLKQSHYDLLVGFGSFFAQTNIYVGRKVAIGNYSIIGTSKIGNNVLISSRVSIISGKYQHSNGKFSKPSSDMHGEFKQIVTAAGEGAKAALAAYNYIEHKKIEK